MAVTRTECGWNLTAAADVATDAGGRTLIINAVVISKPTTTGTVTLRDGAGNDILFSGSITAGEAASFELHGAEVTGLELDTISAGTAIVYAYGTVGGRSVVEG